METLAIVVIAIVPVLMVLLVARWTRLGRIEPPRPDHRAGRFTREPLRERGRDRVGDRS